MKKLAVLCITALGAALLVLGTAPAATAYPELTCNVEVDHQVLDPGQTFTATGTAAGVDAQNHAVPSSAYSWTFEWNGVIERRNGATASASFTAPPVTDPRTITLTARSSSPEGDCLRHIDLRIGGSVVVSAPGGPGSGHGAGDGGLPNTGGPAFWMLVAGLALLLGGGSAVVAARRRS